ncbi:cation transporter [Spiribacter onubensis]|uniref:cation transporter n=1 Tax=Spiribacter onubensis TaxID=3122420 RepID=UPI00349F20A3
MSHDHSHDHSAHFAADTAVSVGVVVSGTVLVLTGLVWIDPVVRLVIAAVIFIGTWQLFKDSLALAIDAVPRGIVRYRRSVGSHRRGGRAAERPKSDSVRR